MKIKREIKIVELPLKASGPRRVLNSMWSFIVNILSIKFILFGTTQKIGVSATNKINALIQLIENEKAAEGSKTENKLVIIFKLWMICCILVL